jgi:hypothetical protein
MKNLLLPFLILSIVSCSNMAKKTTHTNKEDIITYKKNAAELLSLNKSKASKVKLNSMSMKLIELARPIMIGFGKEHPECTEMINTVMDRAETMSKLSLEIIEEQYHTGSALPKASDICYEAKELIVHPATVAIITSKRTLTRKLRTQIDDEIEEVLAHIDMLSEL